MIDAAKVAYNPQNFDSDTRHQAWLILRERQRNYGSVHPPYSNWLALADKIERFERGL